MAFISAAIAAATAWIGGLTWSAVGAFALKTVASMGLSLLAQKLAGDPKGPAFGVKGQLQRGADVPQAFILGNYATAGSLTYANTAKGGNTPNGWMTWVITLSNLPVSGVTGLWVNGKWRVVLATGREGFNDVGGFQYKDGTYHLEARFHDGTQVAADPWLLGLSTPERPFETSAIGTGNAYAVMRAWVNQDLFPNGFPTFLFEVEGIPLYNPALDTSVGGSGTHRWADPATWESSENPAVQLYNVLRGIHYAGEWVYGLQDITAAQIPTDHWIAQIEKCNELVWETVPEWWIYEERKIQVAQFRSSAEIPVSAEIHTVIESLLTACNGRLSDAGGVYKLFAGAPGAPVMSFTDEDILSTSEQSFTPFLGLADTVNGVVAKYPSPAAGWQVETAPPLYRPDYEAEDGGRRLLVDVSLDFVPYAEQAQRIMAAALNEARRARRHTLTLPPAYWPLEPGDVIAWTSERNGYIAKQFRVDGVADLPNADVMLDLTEVDPSDYDWDTVTDFTPPAIPGILPQPIPVQEVEGFAVAPASLSDETGAGKRPAIHATWNGDIFDVRSVKFEIRVKLTGAAVDPARSDTVTDGEVYISAGILPAVEYEVRAKFIPDSPRQTNWTIWKSVTTHDLRPGLDDLGVDVGQAITANQATATQLGVDLAAVGVTADGVRVDHDALVAGFLGNLATAFDDVDTDIAGLNQTIDQVDVDLGAVAEQVTGLLPSDFKGGARYWQQSSSLLPPGPETTSPIAYDASLLANAMTLGPTNRTVAPKAVVEIDADRVYEIEVKGIIVNNGTQGPINHYLGVNSWDDAGTLLNSNAQSLLAPKQISDGVFHETIVVAGASAVAAAGVVDMTLHASATSFRVHYRANGGSVTDATAHISMLAVREISGKTKADYTDARLTVDYLTSAATDAAIAGKIETAEAVYLDNVTGQVKGTALNGYYTKVAADSATAVATVNLKAEMEGPGGSVTAAQDAAQAASDLAGSKGRVFFQSSDPIGANQDNKNLWIDTTGGANTPKRWNGSAWVVVTDKVATDAAAAAAAAQQEATALTGEITSIKALTLAGSTAFGVLLTQLEVDAGGTSAAITNQGTAIADLEGNASAGYLIKAQAGGSVSLLDLIAADGAAGTVSVAKLAADTILLEGTVSANLLAVGSNANLLENTDYADGMTGFEFSGNGAAGAATIMEARGPTSSWTDGVRPVLSLFQSGIETEGFANVRPKWRDADGSLRQIEIEPGLTYEFSAYVSTHRCEGQMYIQWLDANDVALGAPNVTIANSMRSSTDPSAWQRPVVLATAPANAKYASLIVRKFGTLSGTNSYMFVYHMMFAQTHASATEPQDYAPRGITYIDGQKIVVNSIYAEQLFSNELSTMFATIGHFKSAVSGERTEIEDDRLTVFDANNVVRVRLGRLT